MAQTVERRILRIETGTLDNLNNDQIGFETTGIMSYFSQYSSPNDFPKGLWGGKDGDGIISRYASFDSVVRFDKIYFDDRIIISQMYNPSPANKFDESKDTRGPNTINIGQHAGMEVYNTSGSNNAYPNINMGSRSGMYVKAFNEELYEPFGGTYTVNAVYGGSSINLGINAGYLSTQNQSICFGNDSGYHANLINSVAMCSQAAMDTTANHSLFMGTACGAGKTARLIWDNTKPLGFRRQIEEYGVYIGHHAGGYAAESTANVCIGYDAGYYAKNIQDPSASDVSLYSGYNVFLGSMAGAHSNTYKSTFIGTDAGARSFGTENIGIGNGACTYITGGSVNHSSGAVIDLTDGSGGNNIGIGNGALRQYVGVPYFGVTGMTPNELIGSYSIAIGEDALGAGSRGYGNIALGFGSGYRSTGDTNIFIGNFAAQEFVGNRNIFIGNHARIPTGGTINGIGYTVNDNFVLSGPISTPNYLMAGSFATGRLNIQKMLNLTPQSNAPANSSSYKGDVIFKDGTNKLQYFDGSIWSNVGGSGVDTFLALTDVDAGPGGYSGKSYRVPAINTAQTGLVFPQSLRLTDKTVSEGDLSTLATGDYSHAEGLSTFATANGSHSEGSSTSATGVASHAEGGGSVSQGSASHAEGSNTISIGYSSHAEGGGTRSIGSYSHTEGGGTSAVGLYSHSEGAGAIAQGDRTHAEGGYTYSFGEDSHAQGYETSAIGGNSHAGGFQSITIGENSFAHGDSCIAQGENSYAIGFYTSAFGIDGANATGSETMAFGIGSHAEGASTQANGQYSHAEGNGSISTGDTSHAEGDGCLASGYGSHAEGNATSATGQYSHAEGDITQAIGSYSHAEGANNIAYGSGSHAEGLNNSTSSFSSHIEGQGNIITISAPRAAHAEGQYCINLVATQQHVVGIGSDDLNKKNGFEVYTTGLVRAPQESIQVINEDTTNKALVTKEYADFRPVTITGTLLTLDYYVGDFRKLTMSNSNNVTISSITNMTMGQAMIVYVNKTGSGTLTITVNGGNLTILNSTTIGKFSFVISMVDNSGLLYMVSKPAEVLGLI